MLNKMLNPSSLMEKSTLSKGVKKSQEKSGERETDIVNYNQDLIPIRDIIGNVVFMEDGTILSILEILPLNFAEKSNFEKDLIADRFSNAFKQFPPNGHIKVMNSKTDLSPFIRHVISATKNEKDPKVRQRIDDYIEHTRKLQKNNAIRKRFFFIFEYEGDSRGNKSNIYENVMDEMIQSQFAVMEAYRSIGNIVISFQNDAVALADLLYQYFNPKSSIEQDFDYRREKVNQALAYCRANGSLLQYAPYADYVAGRGLIFEDDYSYSDGVFSTWYVLKDTSHPKICNVGWLDIVLRYLSEGDIDIFYKQKNEALNSYLTDRVDVVSSAISELLPSTSNKQDSCVGRAANARYIKNAIDANEEELYDVCIIFTLRADSLKLLRAQQKRFLKKMKGFHLSFEDCYKRTPAFYKSTLPFSFVDKTIFNANKRNYLTSSLAALYCFTAYESFDPEGTVLGLNNKTGTLSAINNFGKRYVNPHISIVGTSGAGKTYLEQLMGSRKRLSGEQVMFILPVKGHEYRAAVESLGGTYISLRPGGIHRINICEIRPEVYAGEDEEDQPSLMSKKVVSLITWIMLQLKDKVLTDEETGDLSECLVSMYRDFGITYDNDSIWTDKDKKSLKVMPIISDIYERIEKLPSLVRIKSVLKRFVIGECSNMNGQTNVSLDNKMLAFDVNENYCGEGLLASFMYIAFDVCLSIAKRDDTEYCSLILDEIWKMLIIEHCAKQIFEAIKILRSYRTSVITATQDIEDCTNNPYGRSILTLSAIKIFLKCEETEIKQLGDIVELSETNKKLMQMMDPGNGFICANGDYEFIKFCASPLEHPLYDKKKRGIA